MTTRANAPIGDLAHIIFGQLTCIADDSNKTFIHFGDNILQQFALVGAHVAELVADVFVFARHDGHIFNTELLGQAFNIDQLEDNTNRASKAIRVCHDVVGGHADIKPARSGGFGHQRNHWLAAGFERLVNFIRGHHRTTRAIDPQNNGLDVAIFSRRLDRFDNRARGRVARTGNAIARIRTRHNRASHIDNG